MEPTPLSDSRRYSTWKAIPFSLFSGDLYSDVARNWKGVGFGYLFLILLLGWIPAAVKIHLGVAKDSQEREMEAFKDIPDFKIKGGEFSITAKQPYFLPDSKTPSIIIDTTGRITSLSQVPAVSKMPSVILITKTEMFTHRVRFGVPEDQVVKFSQLGPLSLEKSNLLGLWDFAVKWAGLLIYPFAVGAHFIYNIFAVLFYALVGTILSKILGAPLNYETLMRLAAVSHTPGLLLALIFFLAGIKAPYSFGFFFLLSMTYLFIAVRAAKATPPPVPGVSSA